MKVRCKTPQEKKALSLARDRRNVYGQNDNASRRLIPLRKRAVNQANRRAESTLLAARSEEPELRLLARRPKRWRKHPDAPLGELFDRRA